VMKRFLPLLAVAVLLISLAPGVITRAAQVHARARAAPNAATTHVVSVGFGGDRGGEAIIFTPKYIDVTVGDTVIWRDGDGLEPHTVSFGPMATLKQLVKDNITPLRQKGGASLLALNPKVANATPGATYDGTGYANSGFLTKGKTWRLTFTRPGTYHYLCLIHGAPMDGYVIVHARPARGKLYIVQAGDGQMAGNDKSNATQDMAFFPQRLTIHVGDTVEWMGFFHTVAFGPEALRDQLEKQFVMPKPQTSGPPLLTLNPKVAFPSGGSTYNGTGFVSSGILFLRAPQNSMAPPTYRLTFTRPGTYTYDCLVHPNMEGSITVLR
jgi:plastocyanin